MEKFPARIHVLLASAKPIGVVIRRGPSKQVCTMLWDRRKDEFRLGQWLKGHIYERRSDISPDGKYLIYFAMNGKWSSETGGSWTAISRTPWLKAITLFGWGDCWFGGGLFTSDRTYWLNSHPYFHRLIRDDGEVRQDETYQTKEYYGGECLNVYYQRLQRDGWTFINKDNRPQSQGLDIFEKPVSKNWILRKFAHAQTNPPVGKGCYWDGHELENLKSGVQLKFPAWEWAERDGKRLVWATNGQIWAGNLHAVGIRDQILLYDFNDMSFQAIAAPY